MGVERKQFRSHLPTSYIYQYSIYRRHAVIELDVLHTGIIADQIYLDVRWLLM